MSTKTQLPMACPYPHDMTNTIGALGGIHMCSVSNGDYVHVIFVDDLIPRSSRSLVSAVIPGKKDEWYAARGPVPLTRPRSMRVSLGAPTLWSSGASGWLRLCWACLRRLADRAPSTYANRVIALQRWCSVAHAQRRGSLAVFYKDTGMAFRALFHVDNRPRSHGSPALVRAPFAVGDSVTEAPWIYPCTS